MAASTKQPFPVESFNGGITDNLFSGKINCGQEMDNFVIQPDGKLFSRSGSVLDDAVNSPVPLGVSRINNVINYARNENYFVQSGRSFFYRQGLNQGPWATLLGPSGNEVLVPGRLNVATSEWNKQMFIVAGLGQSPMKIYKDNSANYQVRNVGLPVFASTPLITPTIASTTTSYIYAFIYVYTYTVNQQTFIEEGPAVYVTVGAAHEVAVLANITNIPVLTNGTGDNYDTANVQVQIYRTVPNGTNLYLLGTVPNGTTSYTDQTPDANLETPATVAYENERLQTQPQLYTNDGTLDYYPAPAAKFIHITGNVGFYGYTQDSFGAHPYRVHQSVVGNPGFVPQITYIELEDEVCGLGSVKALPIALCKRIIYRLDNVFQSNGAGGLTPTKIHNSAGCISHQSVVEAENYLFWAGNDGFYATDGYQVIKVSDHLNPTYKTMLSSSRDLTRIQGRFDEANRRIYWNVQLNPSSLDQDTIFCLDLRWGVNPEMTFTTWSGDQFIASAIEVYNANLYRGDNFGYLYVHDNIATTDPRRDLAVSPPNWGEETIKWNYTSIQLNFGSAFYRKFVSRILLQAENAGNTSIQITANNDQGKRTRQLKPIRWRRNFIWGDQNVTWRNADCTWDAQGLIEQWRRFPAGGLRLSYLQLQLTNAFTIIQTSEDNGQTTIDQTLKTAVLPALWPEEAVDYVLYFANDNYTRGYPVQSINGSFDTLTLIDASGTMPPSGLYDWQLYGYQKNEQLNLIGYTLHWDNVDQNQNTFHASDTGA